MQEFQIRIQNCQIHGHESTPEYVSPVSRSINTHTKYVREQAYRDQGKHKYTYEGSSQHMHLWQSHIRYDGCEEYHPILLGVRRSIYRFPPLSGVHHDLFPFMSFPLRPISPYTSIPPLKPCGGEPARNHQHELGTTVRFNPKASQKRKL
jgi:hypothetical protein